MRSHRARQEYKEHQGHVRVVCFWDKHGARHRMVAEVINAGPTNLWINHDLDGTGDDADLFIPYNRISAVLDKETARA